MPVIPGGLIDDAVVIRFFLLQQVRGGQVDIFDLPDALAGAVADRLEPVRVEYTLGQYG